MKKIISVFLSAIIALSLIGCEGRENHDNSETDRIEISDTKNNTENSNGNTEFSPDNASAEDIIEANKSINESEINLVQLEYPENGNMIVKISTSEGDIYAVLYPKYATHSVQNFFSAVEHGAYNSSRFVKTMDNFLIEARAKASFDDASEISDKPSLNLWNFRGALVIPTEDLSSPSENPGNFMIIQADEISEETLNEMESIGYPSKVLTIYKEQGGIPGYDGRYTVIGQVFEGMDIVDKIASTKTDDDYTPKENIEIIEITNDIFNADIHTFSLEDSSSETDEHNIEAPPQ